MKRSSMPPVIMTFSPRSPSAVGVEVHRAGPTHAMRRMPPHRHLFFELLVCVGGQGSVVVADRTIPLEPRSIVALPPGIEHDCRDLGTADCWSLIFIDDVIDEENAHIFSPSLLGARPAIRCEADAFEAMLAQIACIRHELDTRREGYGVMVRGALQMLLVALGRAAAAAGDPREAFASDSTARTFLADVFAEIDARYTANDALRAAAGHLAVRPAHLTTKVRRLTGRTFGAWVIERRMLEARRLLTTTDLRLVEIAEHLGYAEVESFVRRFAAHHATTPAAWRRAAKLRSIVS